jgi:hypothetical protein
MPAALILLGYQHLCQWHAKSLSCRYDETGRRGRRKDKEPPLYRVGTPYTEFIEIVKTSNFVFDKLAVAKSESAELFL